MLYKKFSKTTSLIFILLIMLGLACGSSGTSSRPVSVQQEELAAIEPEPEEPTAIPLETRQIEEEPGPDPVSPEAPDPGTLVNEPFLMPIEDVFTIRGRGTVIVGTVERGTLEAETEIEIVGVNETVGRYLVTAIEQFNKIQEEALPGQQFGLLLRGANRDDIQIGQVAAAPGSIAAHDEFTADIYLPTQEEGGSRSPVFTGYRPQFHIWTLEVTGEIILPDGVEMVLPGEGANVTIHLLNPAALETGTTFEIMEGNQLIATGVVTSIIR